VGENDLGLTFGSPCHLCEGVSVSGWGMCVVCALLVILCGLSLQTDTKTAIDIVMAYTDTLTHFDIHTHRHPHALARVRLSDR